MSRSIDRLYHLLPVIHRVRDAEQGHPLRALLRVINEQVNVVEDDIARLYDNWFIETCQDWVVPYIGDLIGYRPVEDGSNGAQLPTRAGVSREKILIPRRDVANTLRNRRRKGTLALLEELTGQVAGWPARAVEFYTLLACTQHLNHLRVLRGRTVDLRDGAALDLVGTPFDRVSHTVDVRAIASHRSPGLHNIPNVGVFVWRLRSYSVTFAPGFCLESQGPQCFTFSLLGHDTPLFTKPERESEPTHIADPLNLPVPIRRRALQERIADRPLKVRASAAYYGLGKSIAIYAPGWPTKGAPQPIPPERVIPADLTNWDYRAQRDQVGVDPALGRFVFPVGQLPKGGVWVTYHYGFSKDIGGGEYTRLLSQPLKFTLYRVSKAKPSPDVFDSIGAALVKWRSDQQTLAPEPTNDQAKLAWKEARDRLLAAVVQIEDSNAYSERLRIDLEAGESLQLRAANRTRPVIRMLDFVADQADALRVSGKRASRFALDGIVVSGRGLQVVGPDRADAERFAEGDMCDVTLRHVTLVPGWGLECDCEPKRPNEPSLELLDTTAKIVVEHSIIGSIEIVADEVQTDPVQIEIADSIVDATSDTRSAIGAGNLPLGFATLSVVRSTVIGTVSAHAMLLAENSIFTSHVRVGRRQLGCMRFCYVPPGSRTPRRYHCEPDLARAAIHEVEPPIRPADRPGAKGGAEQRVRPRFTSLRYGAPAYCQLSPDCAQEIKRGADDEAEMGVFHDLFQPQREANLRARLNEYTPMGMEACCVLI